MTARASFLYQPVTCEKITHRGTSGPEAVGVPLGQQFEEFLSSPGGVEATSFEQSLNEVRLSLMRAGLRLAGAILKTADAVLLVTSNPLISSLSADTIVEAQFSDRLRVAKEIGDELSFVVHG